MTAHCRSIPFRKGQSLAQCLLAAGEAHGGRGIIKGRVALVDAELAGCGLSVFILVRTSSHDPDWLEKFRTAMARFPEIVGVYRMTGDLDYVLKARVSDVKAYDRLYQRLIASVPLSDVSASFVMEEIKETTAVPLRA